jgi:hypothetical protein
MWALYLGDDLNDEKRTRKLNKAHIEAMEILKEIEIKNCENVRKEIKENEELIDRNVNEDLKILIAIRTLWLMNEEDRTMLICKENDRLVGLFNNQLFGDVLIEEYKRLVQNGVTVETQSLLLIMLSCVCYG